jgi:ribonuclease HI
MSGESLAMSVNNNGEETSPGLSAPRPSAATLEPLVSSGDSSDPSGASMEVTPPSPDPSPSTDKQPTPETPQASQTSTPPVTNPPITVSSLTAVNGQLYTEEFWVRAKEALLVFIGFPDLSPSEVLDSIEQAYGSCPIGCIKVDRNRAGFIISSLQRQGGLLRLANCWVERPIWPHALLIPLGRNGKPAAAVVPLPALTVRQVPLGFVKPLFAQFEDRTQSYFETGDPTIFCARDRAALIRRFFTCDASFTDLKLLTPLNSYSNDLTPVAVALYPASTADFTHGLECRVTIGGGIYFLLPLAERYWLNASGNFHAKGVCQWCGGKDHYAPDKCIIGENFLKESEAHYLSQMLITYRVGQEIAERVNIPLSPPPISPLPVPHPPSSKDAQRPANPTTASHTSSSSSFITPSDTSSSNGNPSASVTNPPSATEAVSASRPSKLFKPNLAVTGKVTHYFKPVQSSPEIENKEASQYLGSLFPSISGGGGYTYRDAVTGKRALDDQTEMDEAPTGEFTPYLLPWTFTVLPTSPDGNCFYHCLLHACSPIRNNLPGDTPVQLRHFVLWWFENNRHVGEIIITRSLGSGINVRRRLLSRIRSNFTWTDYTTILLASAAFGINIGVFSPRPGLDMCTADVFASYGLHFEFANGEITILFHELGVHPQITEQNPNHFSLLSVNGNFVPGSSLPALEVIFDSLSRRSVPLNENVELISISSSDSDEHEASDVEVNPSPQHKLDNQHVIETNPPPQLLPVTKPNTGAPTQDGINIFCWNATSLRADNRIDVIRDIAKDSAVDIFLIQESGLNHAPSVKNFNAEIAFGNLRPRGALALIKSNICYTRRRDLENKLQPLETVILELSGPRPTLIVGCYFNPFAKIPGDSLTKGLSELMRLPADFIFCGDFNSPCRAMRGLPPFTYRGSLLDDFLSQSNNQITLISDFDYTFFRGDKVQSCLDGCIVSNSLLRRCIPTLLHPLGPGHLPFLVSVDICCPTVKESTRNTSNHILDDKYTDWSVFFRSLEANLPKQQTFDSSSSVVQFSESIAQAQRSALLPRPTRLTNEGWWNERCRIAMRTRNSALRKLQKCHHNGSRKKALRKKYVAARDAAKAVYKEEQKKWKEWLIHGARNQPHSRIWSLITSLCGSKFRRKGCSGAKTYGLKAQAKAEELCRSFERIQSAPDLSGLQVEEINMRSRSGRRNSTQQEPEIEEWEIEEALAKVKTTSSPGPDGIRVTTLQKIWASAWKQSMHELIRSMFRFPNLFQPFKHALVHPIPKPGDPDAFRPIALLSQLGKILERIVATRIRAKMDIPNQFGCYPHRSTRDALIRLQNWAVHARYGAITIFFDVSKAYDRVVPEVVLSKLRQVEGVSLRMLAWVRGFLTERSFQVRLNGFTSTHIAHPLFGLPQGSPLSVVLWQVFLIDLPIEENDNLFMDDITFNIDEDTYDKAEKIANLRLEKLDHWAKENGVIFDTKKTKVLPHEPGVEIHLRFHPGDRSYLPNVSVYKYLGVWLARRNGHDRGFSLHVQLEKDKTDFSYRLNWIKRLHGCSLHVRRTAYISLVRTKLCYPLMLTIRNYETDIDKLQVQALKLICGAMRSTPAARILQLLQLPSALALAKAQAIRTWGKMLAYGGLLLNDYETWLTFHEGAWSEETPFGLIQTVSLAPKEGMTFMRYSRTQIDWCRSAYRFRCFSSLPKPDVGLRLFAGSTILEVGEAHQTTGGNSRMIEGFCDGGFVRNLRKGSTGFLCYEAGDASSSSIRSGNAAYEPIFSSYSSELYALRDLLRCICDNFLPNPRTSITIYSDSRSLISSIRCWTRPSSHCISPLKAEILALITSTQASQITLQWIPGHVGIPGNEIADSLASKALNSLPPQHVDLDLEYVNHLARSFLKESSVFTYTPPRPGNIGINAPLYSLNAPKLLRRLLHVPHDLQRLISRLLLNHYGLKGCYFRHALRKKGPFDPEAYLCRFCERDIETSYHVVDQCHSADVTVHRAALLAKLPDSPGFSLLLHCLGSPRAWYLLKIFFTNLHLQL